VRTHDREPQFAIEMTEDITERKRAEQQLREAQQMEAVGRLVGGVAHDFNNLLTGILLYSDLLAADLEPHGRRHHADEIRLAVEQGAALIQQLLAISRQQVIEPRILSINHTILETGNLLSRLIGENLELCLELDERLGNVKMDPAQVQQILLNLVLNARDAISGTGRITVATTNCEFQPADSALAQGAIPGIQLSVTDTGCGMAAETQSHLFEPFFTTKTSGRGNGLGLTTVQSIVRNAGGTIQVESELGKGTCFTIILPRVPDTPASRVSEILYSPGSGGETVLLVEDNLTVRQAARGILSESGSEVLEAANGAEALAVAQAYPCAIHLLVADLVMPGMSGRELVRELRKALPDLNVLFMTGYEPQPTGEAECNPVRFFRKPFTGAALLEKVHGILEDAARKSLKKCEGKREKL
jgi:two-component system cell cycle sensor histidine kinase/response regulator CckA